MLERDRIVNEQNIDVGGLTQKDHTSTQGVDTNESQEQAPSTKLTLDEGATEVTLSEEVQKLLPDYEDKLDLIQIAHAESEPFPPFTAQEMVKKLDDNGVQAVADLMHGVDALTERNVEIDQSLFTLPSGDTRTWGERLAARAQEMKDYVGSWDLLQAKHGTLNHEIPLPGSDGLSYRVVNRLVNMDMRTQIDVADDKGGRKLGAGHMYSALQPAEAHLTVREIQKETDATPVSEEEIAANQERVAELVLQSPLADITTTIPSADRYFSTGYSNPSESDIHLYEAARKKGLDYNALQRIAFEEVKNKNAFRSEELVRETQRKYNDTKLEHIALAQVSGGMAAETVKIIDPRQSRWTETEFALSEYGIGTVVATELGNRIKSLPPEERQQMITFLQNHYNLTNRAPEMQMWQNLQGVFPKKEKKLNRIIDRELGTASLLPTASSRVIGTALLDATTMYMVPSHYQQEILQGIRQTGVFARHNGDIYQGVASMLGIDVPPYDIYGEDPDEQEFAHTLLATQARQYALGSETFKQMFGAYSIPPEIATPIAEEPSGSVYRVSDLQNGISNLRKE